MQPISKGRRIGYFFAALGAFALSIALQFVAVIVLLAVKFLGMLASGAWTAGGFQALAFSLYENPLEMTVVYHVVGILVFGLWYLLGVRKKQRGLSADKFKPVAAGGVLILGLGLQFLINAVLTALYLLAPSLLESYNTLMEIAGMDEVTFLSILTTCVLAPIGEELLCRGVIQHFAQRVSSRFWLANCIQAALFGILHLNLVQGLYAFVFGLALGAVARKFNSLIPAILLHFVINLSGMLLVEPLMGALPETLPVYLLVCLVAAALCWAGLRLLRIKPFGKLFPDTACDRADANREGAVR